MARYSTIAALFAAAGLIPACAPAGSADPTFVEALDPAVAIDPDLGKPLLGLEPEAAKDDSVAGLQGPLVAGLAANTRVWNVTRSWDAIEPEPGMAWPANSGLTWDEKYAAWVDGLQPTPSVDWHDTFELTTPWGKRLPAPRLECAEAAMFLRATFASWYNLPFYLSAYSPTYSRLFFGHFGIVVADGSSPTAFPRFATAYTDHTTAMAGMTDAQIIAAWPRDNVLRTRALTTLRDDANPFLGEDAYAGAYFDEIFLNKRVGHFMLRLLTNLGSMHLVDSDRNTFNLKPESIRAGDVLLQRWQAQGIGHTVIVLQSDQVGPETYEVETVFGSMPRIQPRWYNPALSKSYFTAQSSGGPGVNSDGVAYVTLGGGLKRWRVAKVEGSRWRNTIPDAYVGDWIDSTHHAALADRTARFEQILGQLTAAERRDLYLSQIGDARRNLELRPASCANRTRREEAFERLYSLNETEFGTSRLETDRAHRTLADYALAELVYNQSKTCCWNSSTQVMHDIIMTMNEERVWDDVTELCTEPLVFKARAGGFAVFQQYAEQIGLGALWVPWSADESCPQANVLDDLEVAHAWTPFCEIARDVLGIPDPDTGGNNGGGDTGGGDTGGGDNGGGNTGGGNTGGGNTGGGNTGGGSSGGGVNAGVFSCNECAAGSTPPVAPFALVFLALFLLRRRARRAA